MTLIQEQAIQLIRQLPDEKIRAIITLAADEVRLQELKMQERVSNKKKAFAKLESLEINFPEDFDADTELKTALEDKYGRID